MLSRVETIEAVAAGLARHRARNVVIDPVMVAASGDPLIRDDAVAGLIARLFPLARLVTPNLHEAARLSGRPVAGDREAMREQARAIAGTTRLAVLLKGGHGSGRESADLLWADGHERWFVAPRIETRNTHGTGCSLSSAIAARLARGATLEAAIDAAKRWLTGAIAAAGDLDVGRGRGPVHHFHQLWQFEQEMQQ
jgi:hydroxymethylpyrimidine/phosphomethylpyrimidine kinase